MSTTRYQQMRNEFLRELEQLCRLKRSTAQVLQFPPRLSEQELGRRQAIIDATWMKVQEQRQELELQRARTCHRGPGDPDWRA
jgi:hypothetical protein